jgi:hypothetical protein
MYMYVYTRCSELRLIGHSFTIGTSYERAAPLTEKKDASAGLSDFSVRGAARRHFFSAIGAALSLEVLTVK